MMQFLAAARDTALVRKLAHHPFERDTVRVLHAEGAGDFTDSQLAGLPADEGEELFLRSGFGGRSFHDNKVSIRSRQSSALSSCRPGLAAGFGFEDGFGLGRCGSRRGCSARRS